MGEDLACPVSDGTGVRVKSGHSELVLFVKIKGRDLNVEC
jgi:hypothetical protein